jgi:hypothetical protein
MHGPGARPMDQAATVVYDGPWTVKRLVKVWALSHSGGLDLSAMGLNQRRGWGSSHWKQQWATQCLWWPSVIEQSGAWSSTRDALMQEVVGLRAKPNVAERDQGVADFYRPGEAVEGRGGGRAVVVVRHQIVSWLREGRRQDGLCFMRGKGEDSMVLWLLDFLVWGRTTHSMQQRQRD